jgi:trans-aconitate 2-methyltransferase
LAYSFGDTATAEERLNLLAAAFDAPSRAFLSDTVTTPPELACDLGCGPGNTTRMVRDVTGARRVIGLDRSAAFTESARNRTARNRTDRNRTDRNRTDRNRTDRNRTGDNQPEFERWDATEPLPVELPDLIYARMLLAHLPAPAQRAADWASQLAPGGLLLLDEIERIDTASETFTDYLTVVAALVEKAGADMYAGPLLGAIPLGEDCRVVTDQVATHPVPAPQAARLFRLNLSVWGDDPWVAARFGPDTTERLDRELARVGQDDTITWQLRQVAIRRDGPR